MHIHSTYWSPPTSRPLLLTPLLPRARALRQLEEVDLSDGRQLLVKRILRPGDGELIPASCTAYVHYTGMFEVHTVMCNSTSISTMRAV
jgi:hypothetical protein